MERIGKFEIIRRLGGGGFGEVFLGADPVMGRDVAIKMFKPKDENLIAFATSSDEEGLRVLRERFLREAKILAELEETTNIINVLEFGETEDGAPWYAMPYVPRSLASELGKDVFDKAAMADLAENERPRSMPIAGALDTLEEILTGLAAAHEAGLVHRDIKPSNILLTVTGQVRIADFGIAKAPDGQHSTVSSLGIGSRNYMAPEQRESAKHVDARADVYSLGVLAYRMLTGRLPTGRYSDPDVHAPEIGPALNRILLEALSENRDGRPADAAKLLERFRAARARIGEIDPDATATDVSDGPLSIIPARLEPLYDLIEAALLDYGSTTPRVREIEAMAHVLDVNKTRLENLAEEALYKHPQIKGIGSLVGLITKAAKGKASFNDKDMAPFLGAAKPVGKDGAWVKALFEDSGAVFAPAKAPALRPTVAQESDTGKVTGTFAQQTGDAALTARVQALLVRLGHRVSTNGRLDARTVKAIEAFETEHGLTPTGDADEVTLEELTKELNARDEVAWKAAMGKDSSRGFRDYVAAWPEGAHVDEAATLGEEAAWHTANKLGTDEAFAAYAREWPDGAHVSKIDETRDERDWQAAHDKASRTGSAHPYRDYAQKWPEGAHIDNVEPACEELAWTKATRLTSIERLDHYLETWPEGPHAEEAAQHIQAIKDKAASRARTRKQLAKGMSITATVLIAFAAIFWFVTREDRAWAEVTRQGTTIAAHNTFLKAWPKGSHAASATKTRDYMVLVQSIQKELASLGYDVRAKDGKLDKRTKNAVTKFAGERRIDRTITPALLTALKGEFARQDEEAWGRAKKTNSERAYKTYTRSFPAGTHKTEATGAIEDLVWQTAKTKGLISTLAAYAKTYPGGKYTEEAETHSWARAQKLDTEESYRLYVEAWPGGAHAGEVDAAIEVLIWEDTKSKNILSAFVSYQKRYPNGTYGKQAESLAWEQAKKVDKEETYRMLIASWPGSGHVKAAITARDSAAWKKAKRVNTEASYKAYTDGYASGSYIENAQTILDRKVKERIVAERNAKARREFVASVQVELNRLDYRVGKTDGTVDTGTTRAVRHFQKHSGKRVTGNIDVELFASLKQANKKPAPFGGDTFRDCRLCPEMVVVEPGNFQMGSNNGSNERPVHSVTIPRAFAVGKFEVTFSEWEVCASAKDCPSAGNFLNVNVANDQRWGRGQRPVINVSWDDAQKYIKWLNRKTGEKYRLMNEAEWEYVAGAKRTSYSWGNDIGRNNANCDGCGSKWDNKKTAPVGSFAPNQFGLYDMHGNVREWTHDCWNENYKGAPGDGSARTRRGCKQRVLRGGSWVSYPNRLRSAFRIGKASDDRGYDIGFRVLRDAS